jgi:hypothetical protein
MMKQDKVDIEDVLYHFLLGAFFGALVGNLAGAVVAVGAVALAHIFVYWANNP